MNDAELIAWLDGDPTVLTEEAMPLVRSVPAQVAIGGMPLNDRPRDRGRVSERHSYRLPEMTEDGPGWLVVASGGGGAGDFSCVGQEAS